MELGREKELEKARDSKNAHLDVETHDGGILMRQDDVERMWGRGTEGLVELGKVSGVMAKLERAEKAVEVVKES